jgi:malonyl CoA-acyl carrier protein transacylase
MDGTETLLLGEEIGEIFRVCSRLSLPVVNELKQKERTLLKAGNSKANTVTKWQQTISQHIGSDSSEHKLFFFGQDIAFAAFLADRFVTVGGIIQAFRQAAESHSRAAQLHQSLAKGSPLAQSHGTRYPIVQGPMARVSDTPAFALEVARRGALPFMAAAWMRRQKLDALLKETRTLLKDRSWGVGLLGFLPPDVYQEQFETVITHRPAFALIAGGQPPQAKALQQEGITTYLHVPSPGLLRMFLDNGLRHFVFEGRESGGHVGPLCGFALWEVMIEELLRFLENSRQPEEYHVLFAGGIHDALSASMAALMAAPLAERGVRVGFQLGSAYLFTQEAVDTGAIVHSYQHELLQCDHTILLETGIGHANRCIETPFTGSFIEEKRRLSAEGKSANEIQNKLESLSRGRLRIASKGIMRNSENVQNPGTLQSISISKEEQRQKGMYLIGQLAALKDRPLTINELHHDIAVEGSKRIEALLKKLPPYPITKEEVRPLDVAIIGMACLLPKAPTVQQYWENILNKVNAVSEIPKERWDWRLYYDPNRDTKDKINSKWGAFLDDIHFDPTRYGLPPSTLSAIEPLQLLTLEVVCWALEDSGYAQRPFPRERTSVILGISGSGELGQQYSFRTSLPTFFGDGSHEIVSHLDQILPNWTEDSFPGILMNVAAGRVANRFNLGGVNCTVDGACASSLTAIYMAARELEANTSDMVIVGGADCMQNPFTYMCFSKTQALSPVMILKRLADAERDGDHIYGLIKGIGASSDGRDKSLTAPGQKGQVRALERAYAKANVSPATVELIEAHATGTTVGDRVEVEALNQVFKNSGAKQHVCAIGSIKSMIGHTKSAAGLASLMKATLALHHKVLPPTNGVDTPNPILILPDTPFYVNKGARPWIHHKKDHPRTAGVSAFGFGGTNFHVVLEEYRNDYLEHLKQVSFQQWPGELLIWSGNSRKELLQKISTVQDAFAKGAKPSLASLAYAYTRLNAEKLSETKENQLCLAVVVNSLEDFTLKLNQAKEALISSKTEIWDPRGVYFTKQPLAPEGKVAFLFPGQGSQYMDMFADLAIQFPEIRECFERSDQILDDKLSKPLSHFIFPTPAFSKEERHSKESALADTQIAQPAMGTADLAMFHLLLSFGIKPESVAGHSYGEYVALCAAGVLSEDDLIALSEARARFMIEGAGSDPGSMAAIKADANTVAENIKDIEGVWIANVNAPQQIVISGNRLAVEKAVNKFKGRSIQARSIPVSCAFHSPFMSKASERLKDFLSRIKLHRPRLKVYSNTTAGPYPTNHAEVVPKLVSHLTSGVEFVREIEAMYEEGVRIFVEVGPGRVLSNLVNQILNDRPQISNQAGRSGLVQLQHLLGQLAVHGVAIKLDRLYEGRSLKDADLKVLLKVSKDKNPSPTTWLVNGARAKPYAAVNGSGPEKIQIDQQNTARTNTIEQPLVINSQEQTPTPEPGQRTRVDNTPPTAQPCGSKATRNKSLPHSGDGTSHVMLQYQQLMQRFLETQKSVMLNYLQGTNDHAEADTFEANQALQKLQTPTVSPTQQISAQKNSSEQAQIETHLNAEPPAQGAAAAPTAGEVSMDREGLTLQLLAIVSELTGYPQEMLDLDLDLEAELGIDSIKRVEILGYFLQFVFGTEQGEFPAETENLTQIKTLRQIIDHVALNKGSPGKSEPEQFQPASPDHTLEHSSGT